jgi:uncharacterized protein YigE (DUF2233 family)
MYKHVSGTLHLVILALLVILFVTISSSFNFIKDGPGVVPAATFPPTAIINVPPTANPIPEPGWTLLRPGLEKRVYPIYDGANQQVESLHIWRLDQNNFRMDIAFDRSPKSLETWQSQTNALMVVNGGFYSIDNERYFPDGLIILNGQVSGRSFNRGGMLTINDSQTELRWLAQESYNSTEPLRAALQSFPILVTPGGGLGFGPERESHATARRTVVAQDKAGRILFMVAPGGYFTLHQLSLYLTKSDLNLDTALNLDGGGSTGILVADPYEIISPTRPLPFVILVYAR